MAEPTEPEKRFDSLYLDHRRAVAAYCRRRVPADVVDDVMAEVFVIAWRRVGEVPHGAELPWLYGVARKVVANQWRSSGRRLRLAERVTAQQTVAADEGLAAEWSDRAVFAAMATLPEPDQELLRLRAWEELTIAEMAVVLGIRRSAVDMRLTRARRRFERALHAVGITATGATGARVATEGLS
jgi:RNA polymerase sigma-70 factor (ECF subfamily)